MTGTTFAAYIRKQTKTNSSTFPNADIVTFANVEKDELASAVVAEVDENYFDMEQVRDLEDGIRDYTFPNDMLKHVKYVAAKLDGTNWVYLTEADISQFDTPVLEESFIREKWAGLKPQFYISGRSLKLLTGDAIIDVTDGLKILAEVYPEDIDANDLAGSDDLSIPSSDTQHSLPRQLHKVWATKVIVAYKQSREKPIPLTQQEQKVEVDITDALAKLEKRNMVRSFVASVPRDTGEEY